MRLSAPRFYEKFKCKADKCQDSCCIGWEINIDGEREALYGSLGGELGEIMRSAMAPSRGDVCAHFVLGSRGRCPLLMENGLCRLISELGDSALTEICREHPRYYNIYADCAEVGLGLSCEAAAELVLTSDVLCFVNLAEVGEVEGDPEAPSVLALLPARAALISRLAADGEPMTSLLSAVGGSAPELREIRPLLSELEWQEDGFSESVMAGLEAAISNPVGFSAFLDGFNARWGIKIMAAALHRHFLDAALMGSARGGVFLAILLALSVALALFGAEEPPRVETVIRATALASRSIEYSVENTDLIIDFGEEL